MSEIIQNKMNALIDKLIGNKYTIDDLNKKIEKKRQELKENNIIGKEQQNTCIYIMLLELLLDLLETKLKQAPFERVVTVATVEAVRNRIPIEVATGRNLIVEALRRDAPIEVATGENLTVKVVAEKNTPAKVTPLRGYTLVGGTSIRNIKKK